MLLGVLVFQMIYTGILHFQRVVLHHQLYNGTHRLKDKISLLQNLNPNSILKNYILEILVNTNADTE